MASAGRVSTGGAGGTGPAAAAAAPEYWLLKLPNFAHDRLAQVEAARAGDSGSQPAGARPSIAATQPIAEIWIRQPKAGEPKHAVRPMKLVLPEAPPQPGQLIPPSSLEFPLVPKPHSTMLVFGQEATTLVPAVPAGLDGRGGLAAQEAFKLSNLVSLTADALPARRDPRFEAAQRMRLAEQQAKQHTVKPLQDARPGEHKVQMLMPQPIKRKPNPFQLRAAERPEKRVRMDADALESEVLSFMSQARFSYLTLAALTKALDQPSAAVQQAARKLLQRVEDGPNKGLYTLKPEYKLAGDDEAVAALAAPQVNAQAAAAQAQAELTGTASAIASGRPSVGANNARTAPMNVVKREL